jgi:hypothetical protein
MDTLNLSENGTLHMYECADHALVITNSEWSVEVAYWHYGDKAYSWRKWWQRVIGAWRMLWFGTVYANSIILSPEAATKLSDDLSNRVELMMEQ